MGQAWLPWWLCWTLLAPLQAWAQDAGILWLTEARFHKVLDRQAPPASPANAETRSLPDAWHRQRANDAGLGDYSLQWVQPAVPDQPWAVYIPQAESALSVWVNGVEIGRDADLDRPHLARQTSPPRLWPLPAALLQAGTNTLHIQLRAERNLRAGLSAVAVGPHASLQAQAQAAHLWRVELPRALNLSLVVAALFMGLLAARRPRDPLALWFIALSATWAARTQYLIGESRWLIPVQTVLGLGGGDVFLATTLMLGFALMLVVVHRHMGRPQPGLESLALAGSVAIPLALAPLGTQVLEALQPAWYGLAVALAAAAGWALRPRADSAQPAALIGLGLGIMLVAALHDWAVVADWLAPTPLPWLVYGPPLMLALVVLAQGHRFFAALDHSAELNRTLEARVQEATLALDTHYQRILQLERATTLADERARLMRDMHDGVGSQLIGLWQGLQRGRLDTTQAAQRVRECMDDLRLVIDSLDSQPHTLPEALANLRFRMEPRLAAAGLKSHWDLAPDAPELSPDAVLHLLRWLQEALTNTLKHAQAQDVWVHWQHGPTGTELSVRDNGRGFDPQQPHPGRGLLNLHTRSQRLGGHTLVHSGPGGSHLQLQLPPDKNS